MSEFDEKAATWDDDPIRAERTGILADALRSAVDLSKINTAMEYGSGTGLMSFALKDWIRDIYLMDQSVEMTRVAKQKCEAQQIRNLHPTQYDLLKDVLPGNRFDLIFILLTLHHVYETGTLLSKFKALMNPRGILAIIDLVKEDGTFHEGEFHGHKGFEREALESQLKDCSFRPYHYEICYTIAKEDDGKIREYPVFLMLSKAL